MCGLVFSHQAVQNWEVKLAPLLAVVLRQRWGSKTGHSRSADETSLKVGGRWQYLCRATDSNRTLFDVYLSTTQSRAAADAFFRSAVAVTVIILKMITTHKYAGYLRALEQVFGDGVEHHPSTFKNNHLEQDRREVNGRPRLMGGFISPRSARFASVGFTMRGATSCDRRPGASSMPRQRSDGRSMSYGSPRCAICSRSRNPWHPPVDHQVVSSELARHLKEPISCSLARTTVVTAPFPG